MKFFLKEYNASNELRGRYAVTAPTVEIAIDKLQRLYAGNSYKECSGDTSNGMFTFREIVIDSV